MLTRPNPKVGFFTDVRSPKEIHKSTLQIGWYFFKPQYLSIENPFFNHTIEILVLERYIFLMELNFSGLTICKRQIQVHINESILAKSGFAYIHSFTVFKIYVPPTLYFQIV